MLEGNSGAYAPPDGGDSVWLVGDRITVKLTSEDTGGAYCVAEEVSPPQGGPPPHIHSQEDETFYVLEGEVEFLLGEDTIVAGGGSCAHAPRGTLPHLTNVGGAGGWRPGWGGAPGGRAWALAPTPRGVPCTPSRTWERRPAGFYLFLIRAGSRSSFLRRARLLPRGPRRPGAGRE